MFDYVKAWASLWPAGEEPEFNYANFRIRGFRGIDDVTISLKRSNLALLLGLNESGKTSLLKAIECFDYRNDPLKDSKSLFFKAMRNKQDVDSNRTVYLSAELEVKRQGDAGKIKRKSLEKAAPHEREALEEFLDSALEAGRFSLTRCIEFQDGVYKRDYYQLGGISSAEDDGTQDALGSISAARELLARSIVALSPFVIYFEDFKDRIPERIYVSPRSEGYDSDWADIIDGLFYHTNQSYSVSKLQKFYSEARHSNDDAETVMQRVNRTLNKVFTEKWKQLSGVRDIDSAKLTYTHHAQTRNRFFEIKIVDSDGTTFSVDERSKGALWYLSFLMKTEFRRKKLRGGSGKPIFLIDEPASNLHASAQQNMIEDFKKLVEDTSVIYTTHSQYLISLDNISNTYIVKRDEGITTCEPWGDYVRGKSVNTTYFQPLADAIKVVPNSFDIPWWKAILTEGPSDMNVIAVLANAFNGGTDLDTVIYPGSAAKSMDTLIALNLGWGATFKILLDGDEEGNEAQRRYEDKFGLGAQYFVRLDRNRKIENLMREPEVRKLAEIANVPLSAGKICKKEFAAVFAVLRNKFRSHREVLGALGESKDSVRALLQQLNLLLQDVPEAA